MQYLTNIQCIFQLLVKSASVRGFFLKQFGSDIGPYMKKQVQYFSEGKLKSFVDKGEGTASGPFIGLEKVADAVEVIKFEK